MHYCAKIGGVSLRDYTLRPEVLADCVIRYHRKFQPDALWLSADTWVTAEAMGAAVAFTADDQPMGGTGEPLIKSIADLDRLPEPDPTSQGRWPAMVEAMRRIRQAIGPDVFIVGCFDQYPFSLACALMGIEPAMGAALEDRALLERLMGRCADYAVAYAGALAEAGADLLSGGDSPAGLLGPRLFREVALPFEQQIIARIKGRTSLPVALHVCGAATPILADLVRTGADVLELDHRTDLNNLTVCRLLPRDIAIWGNLDPVNVLARGTPRDVVRAAEEFIGSMKAAGHARYVLSSGCTLAMETPEENLHALINTAKMKDYLPNQLQSDSTANQEHP